MNEKTNSLDEALRRSKLSSSNQMEMLSFRLSDGQLYGINVFKIIEVVECPKRIDKLPQAHPAVKGIINFRGQGITVIDISQAIGMEAVDYAVQLAYLVVCEYNNQLNAFLVKEPETLLTRGWEEIHKPEGFHAESIVAIAYSDSEEMILILDIENILTEVIGLHADINRELLAGAGSDAVDKRVLLVDDSSSALQLITGTMDHLEIDYLEFNSAVKALSYLQQQLQAGSVPQFDLVVSDIEMPGMDGFTFTRELRALADFQDVPIVLHSSMSNPTNKIKAEEAGADEFIAKFDADALSHLVLRLLAR